MRAIGLDVGSKTIGVALGDAEGLIATARETLRRRGQVADAKAVVALVEEVDAECVVVGLPLELDGREGHRARRVLAFVEALRAALGDEVRVELWDERFSTAAAERTLLEADVSRRRRREHVDAVAAQFILQGWLDRVRSAAAQEDS